MSDSRARAAGDAIAVLVVEHDPDDVAFIRAALQELGAGTPVHPWFHVRAVGTHAEALALLDAAHRAGEQVTRPGTVPDLPVVLLDLDLPDVAGLEALRHLREAAPEAPIVVLTGIDDDALALEAMHGGAQDYLVKGQADGDAIVRAIRHAIARKRAEELAARTQWLAGIGETAIAIRHEVNNPLQSLMLHTELLQGSEEAERQELERAVLEAARRIAAVLKQLERVQEPRSVQYVGGERMLDLGLGGGRTPGRPERAAGAAAPPQQATNKAKPDTR